MTKRAKFILAAPALIITFLVGTVTYIFWPFDISPHKNRVEARTFKLLTLRSTQHDGVLSQFREYESSDSLDLISYTYPSEQAARAFFSEHLQQLGSVILEQAPFLDDAGNRIGERAVIKLSPSREGERTSIVLILRGATVHIIFGNPLDEVLELEKSLDIRHRNLTRGSTGLAISEPLIN